MASPSRRNCRSTRIIIQPLVSYLSLVLNQVWDSPITPTLPCQTYWRKKVNNGSALRMANCFEEIHALFKVCQGTCPCFPRSLRLAHISLYLTVVPHRRLFPALLLPYFMFFSVVIVFCCCCRWWWWWFHREEWSSKVFISIFIWKFLLFIYLF